VELKRRIARMPTLLQQVFYHKKRMLEPGKMDWTGGRRGKNSLTRRFRRAQTNDYQGKSTNSDSLRGKDGHVVFKGNLQEE